MTKDEALDLALEALETLARYENPETRVQVRKPKDNGPIVTMYPHKVATDAITAIKQARSAPVQEPVKLRRGDVLRCIETDELCTVWATSTTHKTLVNWGGNDFSDYTAEQIGELFWLEPESSDVEIAAEQSDNYAAFHAGVRFARAHTPPTAQPAPTVQEPVAWKNAAIRLGEELSSVGPDGYYDMTADQWLDWAMDQQPRGKNSLTTPPAAQRQFVGLTDDELSGIYNQADWDTVNGWEYERAIEAKLRSKNV